MTKTFRFKITSFLIFTLLCINPAFAQSENGTATVNDANQVIRLATTTSTENSGLLKYLLPMFEKDTGYRVHTIAVGTGKALRMGRDGDVDVLLVHAKKAEQKFMAEGHGEERMGVMYNDFVIVGPKNDPAKLVGSKTATEALAEIARSKSLFVSRGDNSGTHKKELSLWKNAKIDLQSNSESWYREAGQGMGKVLQMAGEMDAYTITDRGTWLAFKNHSPLKVIFEGDSVLFNPYGIIVVSAKKYPDLNTAGAKALMHWISSNKGQNLIGKFKLAGKVLFTPNAASVAKINVKMD